MVKRGASGFAEQDGGLGDGGADEEHLILAAAEHLVDPFRLSELENAAQADFQPELVLYQGFLREERAEMIHPLIVQVGRPRNQPAALDLPELVDGGKLEGLILDSWRILAANQGRRGQQPQCQACPGQAQLQLNLDVHATPASNAETELQHPVPIFTSAQ